MEKNLKPKSFQVGNLVLRKVTFNTTKPTDGKPDPNWEGPYVITSSSRIEVYYLEDMYGRPIHNPRNVSNLRKFYH